jgi:hypothetical protein
MASCHVRVPTKQQWKGKEEPRLEKERQTNALRLARVVSCLSYRYGESIPAQVLEAKGLEQAFLLLLEAEDANTREVRVTTFSFRAPAPPTPAPPLFCFFFCFFLKIGWCGGQ